MTLPNEVKYKVRAIALDLETFTVAQLARVTALNPASIRTELQRMKRRGYLASEPIRDGRSKRGAPPHRYQLTGDPEKRLALSRSIEPFKNPSSSAASPPSSFHYHAAETLADQLESAELTTEERQEILRNAHRHLAFAAEEEGIDIRPGGETAVATAYLDLLQARLAIATGQWEQAEPQLEIACRTFKDNGLSEMVTQAESLQNALEVERTLAQTPTDLSLPDRLMTVLDNASGALPLPTVRRMLGELRAQVPKR